MAEIRLHGAGDGTVGAAPAIRLGGLSHAFHTKGGPVQALRELDLDVGRQRILTIVGPSGCGKSTLLRILAGLIEPSQGSVQVLGSTPADARARAEIAFAFQQPVLFPWLKVRQNVLLPRKLLGNRSPLQAEALEESADELLAAVGLEDFKSRYPAELSGGMRQRVAIVRSLLYRPSLLLMDEPFGALDELTREQLNELLLRIWERDRPTIVFVTHSIREALFLGDRVATMTPRPGQLTSLSDVPFARPRSPEIRTSPEFGELESAIRAQLRDS